MGKWWRKNVEKLCKIDPVYTFDTPLIGIKGYFINDNNIFDFININKNIQ